MSISAVRGRRLLLVDDCRDSTIALSMLLEKLGHKVQSLADPAILQAAVEQFDPEVVCLDLAMPNMNGFEAATMLRARGYQGLLIAITGFADQQHRDAAAKSGISHYLVKPVDVADILRILDELPGVS